jgi:hypothetical protein
VLPGEKALGGIKPPFVLTVPTVLTQTPRFVPGNREPHALGRKASSKVPPFVAAIAAPWAGGLVEGRWH